MMFIYLKKNNYHQMNKKYYLISLIKYKFNNIIFGIIKCN